MTGCLPAHSVSPEPLREVKRNRSFKGGFTVCKILGVDKGSAVAVLRKEQKRKEPGFYFWGLVSPSISLESLKGPLRRVE